MASPATYAYQHPQRDRAEQFPAPLLYVAWDDHLMYCAPFCLPVAPTMLFADFVQLVLPTLFGEHPEFARIQWAQAQWRKDGAFWVPRWQASMADNGLGHKDLIRLRTPGMKGLSGSCS